MEGEVEENLKVQKKFSSSATLKVLRREYLLNLGHSTPL